eukprot:9161275-Pyramimonas_sp.AAC.1
MRVGVLNLIRAPIAPRRRGAQGGKELLGLVLDFRVSVTSRDRCISSVRSRGGRGGWGLAGQ